MKLLEPGNIGKLTLKNRVIMAAMGVSTLDKGGIWGERVMAYHEARAKGGAGMITTHSVFVSKEYEPFTKNSFDLYSDESLAALKAIADRLHRYDCKLCVQLTAGFGRVTMRLTPGVTPVSSSENQCDRYPQATARALTTAEAEDLTQAFGRAARRCREAGVDCIEMHGHEGYLLDQFMTALWNRRTDKYGGSREKRLTFTREAIQSIRDSAGTDFPIIYRIGVTHYLPGGRELEEGLWIATELEKMGVAALHIDGGCKENSWWPHPPMYQPLGCMLDLAEKVKGVSSLPVIAVGRLDRPPVAEQALAEGKADFIAIGRGLLADPEWVNKVQHRQDATIIPCIGCHDGCLGAMIHQQPIGCSVNPLCGHEIEWRVTPLKNQKSMLVVGGGPAGIEAARLGIERGFKVSLWEQSDRLGGNLWAASRPDFKRDIRDYIDYLNGLMSRLPAETLLNKKATPDDILQAGADYVVLATGARMGPSLLTDRQGMPLISALEVMNGAEVSGDRVVIMGAGVVGCETAVYLAGLGKKVTVTFTYPEEGLAENLEVRANRDMLILMMHDAGITILPETVPARLDAGVVVADRQGSEVRIATDAVVYASLMLPVNDLANQLKTRHNGVISVGDGLQPGRIMDAVWGAFQAVREIESD
jgi:2-enoate reductase